MSELLPPGLSLLEAPYTVVSSIRTAMVFLSWRENLSPDEQPPKSIWLNGEALDGWFKDVEAKRKAEMEGKKTKSDDGVWDGEMKSNDAVKWMLADD